LKDGEKSVSLEVNLKDTVQQLKEKLKEHVGLPPNKQKLKAGNLPILKDHLTLAYYNITSDTPFTLGTKERGGKKGKK
jgi:hypothetical protein